MAIRVLDRRRRFAMLPFSDPAANELLKSVPIQRRGESIHVAEPDGWVASAGDALIELTRALPAGDRIADTLWRHRPLRQLFHSGYDFVAHRRGTFSRMVPNYPPPIVRPDLA